MDGLDFKSFNNENKNGEEQDYLRGYKLGELLTAFSEPALIGAMLLTLLFWLIGIVF